LSLIWVFKSAAVVIVEVHDFGVTHAIRFS
jgi:hypothetical protein